MENLKHVGNSLTSLIGIHTSFGKVREKNSIENKDQCNNFRKKVKEDH